MSQKIKIMYILGNGRSGSTLLDTILNASEDVLGVGQLSSIADDHKPPCACGKLPTECEFWSKVFKAYEDETGDIGRTRLRTLEREFEGNRNIIRLVFGLNHKQRFEEYKRLTLKQIQAVAHVSQKTVILDSSKMPSRIVYLNQIPELDVYPIHLIRDGRGLLWSAVPRDVREAYDPAHHRPVYPPFGYMLRITKRWLTINLTIYLLKKVGKLKRYKLLKYEDYIADPLQKVQEVCEYAAINFAEIKQILAEHKVFKIGHLLSGNPEIKRSTSVTIESSQNSKHNQWRTAFPLWIRLAYYFMCLPTYLIYHYRFKN